MTRKTRMVLNEATGLALIIAGAVLSADNVLGLVMVGVGAFLLLLNTLELGRPDKDKKEK